MATCFSCGHTSPAGQSFCGSCGSALDLNTFIIAQVKAQVNALTKERDLVETESAIRVFEKALGWAKLIGYFCGLVIAALVAGAGLWGWNLKRTATNVAQLGEEATANINRVASSTSIEMAKQAKALQRRVTESQDQVRVAAELAPNISSLQSQISQAQKQLGVEEKQLATQQNVLSVQQQKLSHSREFEIQLVEKTLANHRTLVFNLPNIPKDKYYISEHLESSSGSGSVLYFLLPSSPIKNSLQISVGSMPAAPLSVFALHNLVAMSSLHSRGDLLSQFISVSYFVDAADAKLYRTISTNNVNCCMYRVYYDGYLETDNLLVDGLPVGKLYPNSNEVIGGIVPYEDK